MVAAARGAPARSAAGAVQCSTAHPGGHGFVHARSARQPALACRVIGLHQVWDGVGPPAGERGVRHSTWRSGAAGVAANARPGVPGTHTSAPPLFALVAEPPGAAHPFMSVKPSTKFRQKGQTKPASACRRRQYRQQQRVCQGGAVHQPASQPAAVSPASQAVLVSTPLPPLPPPAPAALPSTSLLGARPCLEHNILSHGVAAAAAGMTGMATSKAGPCSSNEEARRAAQSNDAHGPAASGGTAASPAPLLTQGTSRGCRA